MAEWTLLDHHLRATCPEVHATLIQESCHHAVIEDKVLGHEGAAFSEGLGDRRRQSRPCPSGNRTLCTSRRLTHSLDQPQHGRGRFPSATQRGRGGQKHPGYVSTFPGYGPRPISCEALRHTLYWLGASGEDWEGDGIVNRLEWTLVRSGDDTHARGAPSVVRAACVIPASPLAHL